MLAIRAHYRPALTPTMKSGESAIFQVTGARWTMSFRNQALEMAGLVHPELSVGNKKPRISGAFLRAAEGTRTLDLLHGNDI